MEIFKVSVRHIIGLWLIILLGSSSLIYASEFKFDITPDHINIGTFYNGTKVKVKGTIPAGADAVLRVSGHYGHIPLKKKGKIAGLLWMNIGDITLKNVPEVFLVVSSSNMKDKIDSPALNLGYKYLEKMMDIEPENEDKTFIFKEFVKLLEKSGTYGIFTNNLTYSNKDNNLKEFSGYIPIPPKMKQGSYKVELFVVKDNKIIGQGERELTLKQVGFPALVSKLAFDYPLIYGIGAVIIAIFAGLVMGILFKGKGGAH